MKKTLKNIIGISLLSVANFAYGASVTANLEDFTNGGGYYATVTITDTVTNTVRITADVSGSNANITESDILGLWFQVNDFTALGSTATFANENASDYVGPPSIITDYSIDENDTNSVNGNNNNLGGAGNANKSIWDLGIATGDNGAAFGKNQTVAFDMMLTGVSASQFDGLKTGMRVQSINVPGFGGSSKLVGTFGPTTTPPPVNTPDAGSTLALMGIALAGLGALKRRK